MTTRLDLICHAATAAVRSAAFPADEPLDVQARQKLGGLSLRPFNADRCWTSPALRAVQTAEALKLDARVEPMLRDCSYGSWTGRTLDEVQQSEPEGLALWLGDPSAAPHGGETVQALINRVSSWLDAQKATPGRIVAVTHASVIRAAIICAIEAEPRSFWRIDVAPLSLTRLSASNGRWTVAELGSLQREPTKT